MTDTPVRVFCSPAQAVINRRTMRCSSRSLSDFRRHTVTPRIRWLTSLVHNHRRLSVCERASSQKRTTAFFDGCCRDRKWPFCGLPT
jgi:hypothetical protein